MNFLNQYNMVTLFPLCCPYYPYLCIFPIYCPTYRKFVYKAVWTITDPRQGVHHPPGSGTAPGRAVPSVRGHGARVGVLQAGSVRSEAERSGASIPREGKVII